jgi:hypothetical protein
MYVSGSATTITVTDADTAYKMDFNGTGENSGVTVDVATNERLTFPTAGKYKVSFTTSFSANVAGTEVYHCSVYKNGAEEAQLEFHTSLTTSGNVQAGATSGIISVTASQYIEVFCEGDTGSRTMTIEHANLSANLIGY